MRLNNFGQPIIENQDDEDKTAAFVRRLAQNLQGRLPRFAKTFVSVDLLEKLLTAAIASMAAQV